MVRFRFLQGWTADGGPGVHAPRRAVIGSSLGRATNRNLLTAGGLARARQGKLVAPGLEPVTPVPTCPSIRHAFWARARLIVSLLNQRLTAATDVKRFAAGVSAA